MDQAVRAFELERFASGGFGLGPAGPGGRGDFRPGSRAHVALWFSCGRGGFFAAEFGPSLPLRRGDFGAGCGGHFAPGRGGCERAVGGAAEQPFEFALERFQLVLQGSRFAELIG